MPKVITELEIKKCAGRPKVVFPSGTVITPSAKDWAKANNLEIIYGDDRGVGGKVPSECASLGKIGFTAVDRVEILRRMICAVAGELEKAGVPLREEILIAAVTESLTKIGCLVED